VILENILAIVIVVVIYLHMHVRKPVERIFINLLKTISLNHSGSLKSLGIHAVELLLDMVESMQLLLKWLRLGNFY